MRIDRTLLLILLAGALAGFLAWLVPRIPPDTGAALLRYPSGAYACGTGHVMIACGGLPGNPDGPAPRPVEYQGSLPSGLPASGG